MDPVIGVAFTATTAGVTLAPGHSVTVSLDAGRSPGAQLARVVRRTYAQGVKRGVRARSVALTWTADADHHAAELSGMLAELDIDLLPIPLASAGAALVADADYADTAVCALEPDLDRGMRGRAVMSDPDGLRTVTAPGLGGETAAEWLGKALGELDRQPRRVVLVGGDGHACPGPLPGDVRVESESESILALAHGAALASGGSGGPGDKRTDKKPVWLTPVVVAAMVVVSALLATMPLGSAGPATPSAPTPPPPVPVPAAVVVAPPSHVLPVPTPVVEPAPSRDAPEANQKQNQSDTSAALPEGRAPQAPPLVVEPVVPAPPHVAEVPDNCVVLCGFVL